MLLAKSVKELQDMVPKPDVDFKNKNYPLEKLYFGSDELIHTADSYRLKNDMEREFIFRMKFISFIVEQLPKHRDYKTSFAHMKEEYQHKCHQQMDLVQALKPKLTHLYEQQVYLEEQRRLEAEKEKLCLLIADSVTGGSSFHYPAQSATYDFNFQPVGGEPLAPLTLADLQAQHNVSANPSVTEKQQPSHQLQSQLSQLDYLRAQLQSQPMPVAQVSPPHDPQQLPTAQPSLPANGSPSANSAQPAAQKIEQYLEQLERLRAMSLGQSAPPTLQQQPVSQPATQLQPSPFPSVPSPVVSSPTSGQHLVIPESLATPEQLQHLKYLAQWKLLDCQQQLLQQPQVSSSLPPQDSSSSPIPISPMPSIQNPNGGLPALPQEYANSQELLQFHQLQQQQARLEAEREKEREREAQEKRRLEAEFARAEDRLQEQLQAQLLLQQKQEALRVQLLNLQQQQQAQQGVNVALNAADNFAAVLPAQVDPNPATNPFMAVSQPVPSANVSNSNPTPSATPTAVPYSMPTPSVNVPSNGAVNPFVSGAKNEASDAAKSVPSVVGKDVKKSNSETSTDSTSSNNIASNNTANSASNSKTDSPLPPLNKPTTVSQSTPKPEPIANDANAQTMQKSSMSRLAGMVKSKPQAPQTLNTNNNNGSGNNSIPNNNFGTSNALVNANGRKDGPKEVPWTSHKEILSFFVQDYTLGKNVTGLNNLGNTCWLNSILQCLSATTPFVAFFHSFEYRKHLREQNQHAFIEEFAQVLFSLWQSQASYEPSKFLAKFRKRVPDLSEYMAQQDAHEALTYILDLVHGDINRASSNTYHRDGPPDAGEAMLKHKRRDDSFVWDIFGGQLESRMQCDYCQAVSLTYDHFTSISLEVIPNASSMIVSLFEMFTDSEKVEWLCPKCKHASHPRKKLKISKLPIFLVLHLKRFRRSLLTGESKKIESLVHFPLTGLDMSPFVTSIEANPDYTYNLYAVANQTGSLNAGHYTAYVRKGNYWYLANDSQVTAVMNPEVIPSPSAYILFYHLSKIKM